MEENNSLSDAVIKIMTYVNEHLHEPITASELAAAAGYSQYHIIRIFKKETGLSPFEYIRQKRLVSSAFELRRGKLRVIDVALNYVIDLPPCKYLIFQGEPYDDEKYDEAVGACMNRIGQFNPEIYGYAFDDEIAPKFQLAPMGWRGYIEGRPVREIENNFKAPLRTR